MNAVSQPDAMAAGQRDNPLLPNFFLGQAMNNLPPEIHQKLDHLCDRFEDAWQAGQSPGLDDFLRDGPADAQTELFEQLLRLELDYRRRRNERPIFDEYRQRYPEFVSVLETVFEVAPVEDSAISVSLTAIEGPNQGTSFTFDRHDTFVVGRSADAGFRLPEDDPHVSRNHFLIEINPPACRILDLNSKNGTWRKDERIAAADLKDGDEIRAGKTSFKVRLKSRDDPFATRMIEPAPAAAPASPETIAHDASLPTIAGYRIDCLFGKGGMGAVYRATRLSDGATVAIKTIKPSTKQPSRDMLKRFLRETEIMRSLNHPGIVAFCNAGEVNDLLYFAMQYINGVNAAELHRAEAPLAIGRAVRLICQVLDALAYAHGRQIIHRDLKPVNVLVSLEKGIETARLTDFGLARAWHDSPMSGLTVTGHIAGTPAYMPPEQILNFRTVGSAGDQYSAAATLYNLLTGMPLFDCKNDIQEVFRHILQKDPVPLNQRRPDVPETLAKIVARALARKPSGRFQSVEAFRAALLPFGIG